MTNYEYASEQFEKLLIEIDGYRDELSEADTRCKIIDKILTDCLGWEEKDIRREEYVNAGYIDYVIRKGGNGLIIEAKKTSIEFNLPSRINNKSRLSIGNLLEKERDLKKHYGQVTKYCFSSGIQFGCFTNGLQWIIFAAIRTDGIQVHNSKVIVFNGLNELNQNFIYFYNLFSKDAIESQTINRVLLPEIGDVARSYIINDDERKNEISDRNIVSGVIAPLLPNYFGDLIGEDSIEKLTKCYVESEPMEDKPLSKTVASAPNVYQHRTQTEAAENLKRSINVFSNSTGHNGILYFILGRVGSGKSTFLYHFFFVSNVEFIENYLVYYLNCLEYREDKSISDFFIQNLKIFPKTKNYSKNILKLIN